MILKYNLTSLTLITIVVCGVLSVSGFAEENVKEEKACEPKARITQKTNQKLLSVNEARGQARVLHDVLHSTLLIVHRKYYREDEKLPIPSSMLDDVFEEMQQNKTLNSVGFRSTRKR